MRWLSYLGEKAGVERGDSRLLARDCISIQEVDDSAISTIEPDSYYEEEIVGIDCAEEGEDQRQPQSPQIYAYTPFICPSFGESGRFALSLADNPCTYPAFHLQLKETCRT
jgi:hypothetical protein